MLGIALARHTGRQDVVVGVPTANRTDSDCLDVVGFFANNVVLRTRVDFAQSFDTFVRAVAENVQRTFAHHQTPFAFVVDALSPSRSSAHNPIFQIAFAFQNSPEPGELLSGLHARPLAVANRRAKFDLTINVAFTGDAARIDWEYDSNLFLPATIEALAAHYLGLLRAATPMRRCTGSIRSMPTRPRRAACPPRARARGHGRREHRVPLRRRGRAPAGGGGHCPS